MSNKTVERIVRSGGRWKIHVGGLSQPIELDPAIAQRAGVAVKDRVNIDVVDDTTIITISVPMRVRCVVCLRKGRIKEILDQCGNPFRVSPPAPWGDTAGI